MAIENVAGFFVLSVFFASLYKYVPTKFGLESVWNTGYGELTSTWS